MLIDLRDYQVEAMAAARGHLRNGARAVLVNSPTGSGKTVLAAALMEHAHAKGRRASFVVDRLSLVDQTGDTLRRYGLDHGVIQSTHPNFRPSLPLQVCSIQTVAKRGWPEADLDLFDEAHVLHRAHKGRLQQANSVVIGLTATPFTKGLGKWFPAVVNVTTTRKLIDDGWLVPYRMFSCASPDMTGVKVMSTGEWDSDEASGKALEVVGDVVSEYLKHGDGRKFICSAVDTAHVAELCRQFQAAGINVASYTYRDDSEDRQETTVEFRKPNSLIRGLVTVTAASRGFDIADVGCIIMARPLRKSLAEHIQLLGRGLRISPDTGKSDCVVLDHSGNAARFYGRCEGFFDHGIDELDDGKEKKAKPPKIKEAAEPAACPSCNHIHPPRPTCPSCGYEYPRRLTVQHVPGTLSELIKSGQHQHILDRDIFPQIAGYVLAKGREGDAARKMAQAIFRDMTGNFAHRKWDSIHPISPTKEVLSRIRAAQIRYAKGREKGAEA